MKLSKKQLDITNALQNGGYLWFASGHPYLAFVDKDGRIKSQHIHLGSVKALIDAHILKKEGENKWVLK